MSTPSVTAAPQKLYLQAATAQPGLVDTVKSKTQFHHSAAYELSKSKSPIPIKKQEFTSYEMTDGEYDSDDDDEEEDLSESNKKLIPDWARSKNLEKALEVQFSKSYPIDPDTLFGEVETCNLEAIFGKRSSKYRHRNSSGDWTKDRVTEEEKRWYKLQIA
jgi:Inner centromere protein, ARK binding region